MIPVNGLIALFAQMYKEHWAYKWGSAKRGEVDCSGAFVWAYKQFGESIYHGSNSIARKYCGAMGKEPHPGYAAFKWKAKDTAKYPDGRGDFYHIGLVAEDGAHVYEARGTKAGFTRSAVSAWHCFAPLADVEYGNPIPPPADAGVSAKGAMHSSPPFPEQEKRLPASGGKHPIPPDAAASGPPFPASREGQNVSEGGGTMEPYNAIVSTASGSLNMRSGPGLSYPITFKLPKGTPVTVLIEYASGWAFIDEDGTQGYVALKYLTRVNGPESAQGAPDAPDGEITAPAVCTRLRRADGVEIDLAGIWEVVTKPPDERGGD